MIQITEKSPITTHINDDSVIRDFLTYKYEWWRAGPFHKIKETGISRLVKNGYFLSGFQKRVFDYLDKRKIEYAFAKPDYKIEVKEPKLEGIDFKSWLQDIPLAEMIDNKRGVWKAPTAAGKTIIFCGLVSAFQTTVLVIVHTTVLFEQTIEELERFFGHGHIGMLGCGKFVEKDINVGMIQTLDRWYKTRKNDPQYGMVIVDEAHHCNFDGSYGRVLKKIQAPVRFGLTATLPKEEKGKMALEGLIGPVIGQTDYKELQEKGILAKPIVKVYKVPVTDRYEKLKGGYRAVYGKGIVNNRTRNQLIVEKAKELLEQRLTVLIMIERIEHGDILYDMAEVMLPGVFCFLQGQTEGEIKSQEKWAFEEQDRRGVIATKIWGEGINVRSIGAVINAVGGESEIAAIQRFGRGMRRTKSKQSVILIDFIDLNHEWFRKHSLKRICTYLEAGWKIEQ